MIIFYINIILNFFSASLGLFLHVSEYCYLRQLMRNRMWLTDKRTFSPLVDNQQQMTSQNFTLNWVTG